MTHHPYYPKEGPCRLHRPKCSRLAKQPPAGHAAWKCIQPWTFLACYLCASPLGDGSAAYGYGYAAGASPQNHLQNEICREPYLKRGFERKGEGAHCLLSLPMPFSLSEALSDSLRPSMRVASSSARRRRERRSRPVLRCDSLPSVLAVCSVSVLSSTLNGLLSGSLNTKPVSRKHRRGKAHGKLQKPDENLTCV